MNYRKNMKFRRCCYEVIEQIVSNCISHQPSDLYLPQFKLAFYWRESIPEQFVRNEDILAAKILFIGQGVPDLISFVVR